MIALARKVTGNAIARIMPQVYHNILTQGTTAWITPRTPDASEPVIP
jgi:hypothetical protein